MGMKFDSDSEDEGDSQPTPKRQAKVQNVPPPKQETKVTPGPAAKKPPVQESTKPPVSVPEAKEAPKKPENTDSGSTKNKTSSGVVSVKEHQQAKKKNKTAFSVDALLQNDQDVGSRMPVVIK